MPGPGFLDLPVRSAKPRRTGITHALDRGIPLAQAIDLLEQNGCYVDVWKFGGAWTPDSVMGPEMGPVMGTVMGAVPVRGT